MRIYEEKIVGALRELGDRAYQARVWTGEALPDLSSFVECVETLFDDSGLGSALEAGKVFGDHIDAQLRVLSEVIDRIESDEPYEVLAADANFDRATRLAVTILEALQKPDGGDEGRPMSTEDRG
ncbi:hypothetical protein [Microlunatus sp. GCM10028923]|uniref:hypothetical protein n=1 Tax=Microlunatus sp. GCM10028923 TaxID=3273400 RepID=UPI003611828C